ncbi:MAG: LysE family translocator [Rhodoferax sp.]|uniref:LysE family translocator n=1 Tax=Rhodoferax sp. TaxID=50421 RepID=UPI0026263F9A|nr:LysE family translocator [Rhodoferax sp.]MDD5334349.1 LysE family translocator [Rhodoferax sp.]
MSSSLLTAQLGLAYATYLVGAGSPGPSNMAIMGMAMSAGRKPALWLTAGVVSGSLFWGALAALGVSQVLATFTTGLIVMKVVGGLYLLWLALKSARAARRPDAVHGPAAGTSDTSARSLYLRGASMHLTNPKAILSWLAVVTLALPPGAPRPVALLVLAGCMVLGVLIFGGYALAFSTATARRLYTAARRWLESLLAAVFGYAGCKLLHSATQSH